MNEHKTRNHCFSVCFSDRFNTTNVSSSIVKQNKEILHFSGKKIIFDAFKKNLKKGKFWQERKKMPPPPPAFFRYNH